MNGWDTEGMSFWFLNEALNKVSIHWHMDDMGDGKGSKDDRTRKLARRNRTRRWKHDALRRCFCMCALFEAACWRSNPEGNPPLSRLEAEIDFLWSNMGQVLFCCFMTFKPHNTRFNGSSALFVATLFLKVHNARLASKTVSTILPNTPFTRFHKVFVRGPCFATLRQRTAEFMIWRSNSHCPPNIARGNAQWTWTTNSQATRSGSWRCCA